MAKKLKNLEITKVDFVDEGANQRADIKLYKKKDATNPIDAIPLSETESIGKRLLSAIGKVLGINAEEVQKGAGAQTFGEKITEVSRQKIVDEIWSVCYALQSSLASIVNDEELDGDNAAGLMEQSLSEFDDILKTAIADWSKGKNSVIKKSNVLVSEDLEGMKTFRDTLDSYIQKANQKGELEEMIKIDKSKMTPEERAAYEAIVNKYATEEKPVEKAKVDPEENEEEIDDEEEPKKKKDCKKNLNDAGKGDDVYKNLHPAVKAEIESLKKFREEAETRELMEIAKKYEVIGKKPEELVNTLKSLRAAGGTAYDEMISVLDGAVSMAEVSGTFSEIGKSGGANRAAHGDETIAKVRAKAAEIRKSRPELSEIQAMDQALIEDAELRAEFDQ